VTASEEFRKVAQPKTDWDTTADDDAFERFEENLNAAFKRIDSMLEVEHTYPVNSKGKPIPPPPGVTDGALIRKRKQKRRS